MNLCQLNTFFLTFWLVCCAHTANRPKSKEKSVQLTEVHLYWSYFLQNPYFNEFTFLFFWVFPIECFKQQTKKTKTDKETRHVMIGQKIWKNQIQDSWSHPENCFSSIMFFDKMSLVIQNWFSDFVLHVRSLHIFA